MAWPRSTLGLLMPDETVVLEGRGRLLPGGAAGPVEVDVRRDRLHARGRRRDAGRRLPRPRHDRGPAGPTLLVLGAGPARSGSLLDQFGQAQGQLVRELRDRRLRQRLADALVDAPDDPIDLVEYGRASERGVAQLVYHPWGAVVAPLDERVPWIRVRRGGHHATSQVDEAAGTRHRGDRESEAARSARRSAAGPRARTPGSTATGSLALRDAAPTRMPAGSSAR